MRVLLDTHIFLWAVLEPERLPDAIRALIESPENELVVSAASAWEIATKFRLGKLPGAAALVSIAGHPLYSCRRYSSRNVYLV